MKVTIDSQDLVNLERECFELKRRIALIHAEVSPAQYDAGTVERVYKLCTEPLPPQTCDISCCRDDTPEAENCDDAD